MFASCRKYLTVLLIAIHLQYNDILIPISRTNIAALFVILFIYGWNQYLWPLLITTDPQMNTIVMGIKQLLPVGDMFAQNVLIPDDSISRYSPFLKTDSSLYFS